MNLNEYVRRKESLIRRMLRAVAWVFQQFIVPGMSLTQWRQMLAVLYRVLVPFREEGTELARQFFDTNREEQTGLTTRHNIYKDDHYPFEWLAQDMRPTYVQFQQTKNVEGAINDAVNRAIKVVEDAQRHTLIQGVSDDFSRPIRGWARFDPKPPTCAFCTMMISRGPVYSTQTTAAFKGSKELAAKLWQENDTDAMNQMMHKWHPGCTCVAVPVYKFSDYPSEAQELEAFEIYKEARKRAKDKTYKGILLEMRKELRGSKEEDETTLTSAA